MFDDNKTIQRRNPCPKNDTFHFETFWCIVHVVENLNGNSFCFSFQWTKTFEMKMGISFGRNHFPIPKYLSFISSFCFCHPPSAIHECSSMYVSLELEIQVNQDNVWPRCLYIVYHDCHGMYELSLCFVLFCTLFHCKPIVLFVNCLQEMKIFGREQGAAHNTIISIIIVLSSKWKYSRRCVVGHDVFVIWYSMQKVHKILELFTLLMWCLWVWAHTWTPMI